MGRLGLFRRPVSLFVCPYPKSQAAEKENVKCFLTHPKIGFVWSFFSCLASGWTQSYPRKDLPVRFYQTTPNLLRMMGHKLLKTQGLFVGHIHTACGTGEATGATCIATVGGKFPRW